jgi:hypothetical protein
LIHLTFFEDKTKCGDPTIFHAHSIVCGTENPARVERYFASEWKKVRPSYRSTPPFIEKIYYLPGMIGYVSKQMNNDYEILVNLP